MKKLSTLLFFVLSCMFAHAATAGALSGVFSVSATKKIYFSKGNLQYQASTGTWRFAVNQYDCIGADNSNISSTYTGWIDLFGWSTSSTSYGVSTSTSSSAYGGDFVDWGRNAISNGGNTAGLWQTLSKDEWVYLLETRADATSLCFRATVNGTPGLVLLPDGFSKGSFSYTTGVTNFTTNTYTTTGWGSLEAAGAVFLPAAGGRSGTSVTSVGTLGRYSSSTSYNASNVFGAYFNSSSITSAGISSPYVGRSVRLVQPLKYTVAASSNDTSLGSVAGGGECNSGDSVLLTATPADGCSFLYWSDGNTANPRQLTVTSDIVLTAVFAEFISANGVLPGRFSVSATKKVQFSMGNLQYQASTGTWRFAENQYDFIGSANSSISNTYTGWIDLFGWSTTSIPYGVSTSNAAADYSGAFIDWGRNAISNGGNTTNQWYTLSKDEWVYLFETRTNASSLCFRATVNSKKGFVLLPDGFVKGSFAYTTAATNYTTNTYTATEWLALEAAGAVFLPCAGYRLGTTLYNLNIGGHYWSSTLSDSTGYANNMYFMGTRLYSKADAGRHAGESVRLVMVKPYTITFDANGGTCATANKTVLPDSTYGTLPVASRAGYTFAGWYTAASGGTQRTAASTVALSSNETLYVHWTANSYAISFDANGGTCATTSKNVTVDCQVGLLPVPSRAGYTFAGWYTQAVGGNPVASATICTFTSAVTLYAHWEKCTVSGDCSLNGTTLDLTHPLLDTTMVTDLGLGCLWAKVNLGGAVPSDCGDSYAWGETTTKSNYIYNTYLHGDGTNKFSKYVTSSGYGTVDGLTQLEPADDAATQMLGAYWSIPTKAQMDQLRTGCTWSSTTLNGVTMAKVLSKGNGNYILLPRYAERQATGSNISTRGLIQTSTLGVYNNSFYTCQFYSGGTPNPSSTSTSRTYGVPIRPVCTVDTLRVYAEGCTTPNTFIAPTGTEISVEATPRVGYHFVSWTDGNTSNPRIFEVGSTDTATAVFAISSFLVNGQPVEYGSTLTFTAPDSACYTFQRWSNGVTSNPVTITVTSDTTVTPVYTINRYIITTSATNGTITGGGTYDCGEEISLTATADAHYHFTGWTDGVATASRSITVSASASYTATFEKDKFVVNGQEYEYGATATLTATAPDCQHFTQWSDGNTDNPRTFTVTGAVSVTPLFATTQYTITFKDYNGTILQSGPVDCGTTPSCASPTRAATPAYSYTFKAWSPAIEEVSATAVYTATYDSTKNGYIINGREMEYGSTLTLTAPDSACYTFQRWSNGVTSNPCSVVVTSDTTVTPVYTINRYTITTSATNGTVTGGGTYDCGEEISLTATADAHYHFVSWSDGVATKTRTITVTESASFTATFAKDKYTINGEEYEYGATATLTAMAPDCQHFTQWSDGNTDNPRTFTVTGAVSFTPQFATTQYIITFKDDKGTVLQSGLVDCGTIPQFDGTPVKQPEGNYTYTFSHWQPALTEAYHDTVYTAVFTATAHSYTLTLQGAHGTVEGAGTYPGGTEVNIAATPDSAYHFAGWSDGSADAERTITLTIDSTLTALFLPNCEDWAEWPVLRKYDWLLMLDVRLLHSRGYVFNEEGVEWYRIVGEVDSIGDTLKDDEKVGSGYYLTLSQNLTGTGSYYAVVDASSSTSTLCSSLMRTEIANYSGTGGAAHSVSLMPSISAPGQPVRIVGLNPAELSTIQVYSGAGLLLFSQTSIGESSVTMDAACVPGCYQVRVSSASVQTTLRYIVNIK